MIWHRGGEIAEVANALSLGEIAIVPTETVYGIAATLAPDALLKVFHAKGRPEHKPLIVAVEDQAMAQEVAAEWPAEAKRLADRFWPGPLSLAVPKADRIPYLVTAGGPTIAVRAPADEIVMGLLRLVGQPLVLTSANRTGEAPPRSAPEAVAQVGLSVAYVIDNGPSPIGVPSTVYDVTTGVVVREGAIQAADLA